MAEGVQVKARGRVGLAVEGPVLHLVIVPLVSDTTTTGQDLVAADVTRRAKAGKVLAVGNRAATLSPVQLSVSATSYLVSTLVLVTYMS